MNEHAPTAFSEDTADDSARIDDVEKAHAMAIESNAVRTDAARARGIGRLILEEVQQGTDKWGRDAAARIANRTQEVEEHVFRTGSSMTISEDMHPEELQKVGISARNPMAGNLQFQRFYDARHAVNKNGGDAEKAVEQIAGWSEYLDQQADAIEDRVAAEYDSRKPQA